MIVFNDEEERRRIEAIRSEGRENIDGDLDLLVLLLLTEDIEIDGEACMLCCCLVLAIILAAAAADVE